MAKKVIANPDDDAKSVVKKKKRSKCCTCLIVFAIVSIVLIAVIIGVGWYFGDKYTKQFFGMSLGDTLDVLGDLYWTDDSDVVSRKYSQKDLDGFYDELKRNVLLKTDADIDFDSALFTALDNYLGTNMSGKDTPDEGDDEGEVAPSMNAGAEGEGGAGGNAVVDIMVDMLAQVFTKENIDIEGLKKYDQDNDNYIFDLKDKQIAAFVNLVLDSMLKNAGSVDFLSAANDFVPLRKVVKLKQVKYTVQAKTDEQGMKTKATAADITVWLGMQDAAGYAVKKLLGESGFGWAGGFASWLCDVILPENVYVHVTVPLEDGAEPRLSFNTMNTAERKQMYKLVNGVFKNIMNSDYTVEGLLKTFADKMTPFLKKTADAMDFSAADKGSIKIDFIDVLVKKVNEDTLKKDPVTKSEVMYMLQALLTTTPDEWLHAHEPYLYREWYADANGGNAVYRYDSSIDVTGKKPIDYGKMFIDELEEVYSLDFGDDAEMTDVLEMLGISFDSNASVHFDTDALLKKISKKKLEASLDPSNPIRELRVTDRMLAAALSGELDSMMSEDSSKFKDLTIDLDAMTFVEDEDHAGHTFALLAVRIGIDKLFDSLGDNKFFGLIKGLLPESVLMSMKLDITLNLPAGEDYIPAQFMLNDYERTDGVIDTLKKFMPDFDMNDMTDQVETMLRKVVDGLEKTLDIELVTSDLTKIPTVKGEMVMPDIYSVVVNTMLTKDGVNAVTNAQLKSVLYGLNNTDSYDEMYADGANIDSTSEGFIDQVVDKYYLNPDPKKPIKSFDDLTDFLSTGDNDSDFGKKFRVKGTDTSVKYLAYDTRKISDITPFMTEKQLGAIINDKKDTMAGVSDMNVLDVDVTKTDAETSITVTMSVDMSSLVPEKVQSLMSIHTIYFTVTVDLSIVVNNAYPVEYTVNSMSDADVANLLAILDCLGGSFDIDGKTAEFGKILYEQLDGLKTSLGDENLLRIVDGGIELASFYEFLSTKLGMESDVEGETNEQWAQRVKDAVQSMYEQPKDEAGNYIDAMYAGVEDENDIKNYRIDDFIFNPPDPNYKFDDIDPSVGKNGGEWYDKQFNAWFQTALARNNVIAMQTVALTSGDDGEVARRLRTWANARMENEPLSASDDHIVVTFMIPTTQFDSNGDNADTASGFLPNYLCATVALDMVEGEDGNEFRCVGTVLNNMGKDQYALLMKLMGLNAGDAVTDPNKVNVKTITDDCIDQINKLLAFGKIALKETDNDALGVGIIGVTPKITIPTLPTA